jgi:hypothetical protein
MQFGLQDASVPDPFDFSSLPRIAASATVSDDTRAPVAVAVSFCFFDATRFAAMACPARKLCSSVKKVTPCLLNH